MAANVKTNEDRDSLVAFRLSVSEKQRLEALARASERTVSELLRLLVRRAVVEPGRDVLLPQEWGAENG